MRARVGDTIEIIHLDPGLGHGVGFWLLDELLTLCKAIALGARQHLGAAGRSEQLEN